MDSMLYELCPACKGTGLLQPNADAAPFPCGWCGPLRVIKTNTGTTVGKMEAALERAKVYGEALRELVAALDDGAPNPVEQVGGRFHQAVDKARKALARKGRK